MRNLGWCAAFGILLTLGCSRKETGSQDSSQGPGRPTDPGGVAASAQPMASGTAVASAEQNVTREGGPLADNMGRNFEGRLQLRVTGLPHPMDIRYMSHGERGRLQVDRPGSGAKAFDAIFAGDQVIVFDHEHRRYRAQALGSVAKKSEPDVDVKIERTSDRREMSGLLCYPWHLTSGTQKIDACVRGLPGPFDTDKLETLSGFDVPAWVEKVIGDHYLPVAATVTDNGRELYKVELVQYSPDQVPENELSVPANYQKL